MINLERTKTFIKDISRIKFTDTQYSKYILYVGKLLQEEALPYEARDHHLVGNWGTFREFHIYMKHHSPEIHISTSAMSFSSFLSEFILHCLVCIKTSFLLRLN